MTPDYGGACATCRDEEEHVFTGVVHASAFLQPMYIKQSLDHSVSSFFFFSFLGERWWLYVVCVLFVISARGFGLCLVSVGQGGDPPR